MGSKRLQKLFLDGSWTTHILHYPILGMQFLLKIFSNNNFQEHWSLTIQKETRNLWLAKNPICPSTFDLKINIQPISGTWIELAGNKSMRTR